MSMNSSTITITVGLGEDKIPDLIEWEASGTTTETVQQAKGMILSFWDGLEKTAMRVDLWTKDMMVDEMADFFYQTISTMADTYNRATKDTELSEEMKTFAKTFYKKFREKQTKQ